MSQAFDVICLRRGNAPRTLRTLPIENFPDELVSENTQPSGRCPCRGKISAAEESWSVLPHWVGDCYERGQMVVANTGITIFNGYKALKAQPSDFVVRDRDGIFSVYDPATFEKSFVPAHSAEVHKLHAA